MAKPNTKQFILISINDAPYTLYKSYIIKLGEIDGIQTISILNNYFTYHMFTRNDIFKLSNIQNLFSNKPFVFIFNDYYLLYKFQGIMPDSRAAKISLVSEPQVLVL